MKSGRPLNGVIPMLDLLATTKLGVEQIEILNTARTSANQMKQIVDDILDYSKLEANKLRLESTGLNIREIVHSVVQMFNSQAVAKRISIHVFLDPSLRLALRGDPVRLRQVLSNILSNAIKFTGKGSISISVRAKSETRQHHLLRFEIKGQRHRHFRGKRQPSVQTVQPGRCLDYTHLRRHRSGPGHLQTDRRPDVRPNRGGLAAGYRLNLLVRDSAAESSRRQPRHGLRPEELEGTAVQHRPGTVRPSGTGRKHTRQPS